MTKIYLDEINKALSFSTFDILEKEESDADTFKNRIDSFQSESAADLTGEMWDKVRSHLTNYNSFQDKRKTISATLASNIRIALESLRNYMGEDQMLDTSQLSELKSQRQVCSNSLSALDDMLGELEESGEDDSKAQELKNQISLAGFTLSELDRLIKKLEGLDDVYNNAKSILDESNQQITQFRAEVSAVKPSGKYKYQKAS